MSDTLTSCHRDFGTYQVDLSLGSVNVRLRLIGVFKKEGVRGRDGKKYLHTCTNSLTGLSLPMMTSKGEGSRVGIMFHKPKSISGRATQLLLGIKADGNPHVLPTISYVQQTLEIRNPGADARAEGIKLRKGRQNWFSGLCDDKRSTNSLWKLKTLSICGDHQTENLFKWCLL